MHLESLSLSRRLALALVTLAACAEPDDSGVELVEALASPVDATPSADGREVYVVTDAAPQAQLLVLREGEVVTLAEFEHPRAVVTDAAGIVYVADTGVDAVFAVDPEGNATIVPGSEGLGARALQLGDALYVAGSDASGGALFELPREGGTATLITAEFPGFIDGVAQTVDGSLYVTGERSAGSGAAEGALFEIVGNLPILRAEGLHLGSPAGIALTPDDTAVMISALSPTGTSEVVIISREDGARSIFDAVIGDNRASGGLHRAADEPTIYAWADSEAAGGVYRVTF